MPKVFLCHSSNDKPFAARLNTSLLSFGIGTWLDEAEILPGDSLIGKIEEGLSASDYLVVVLSPASVNSEWCRRELRSALTFEIAGKPLRVVPIIAAPCKIPPFIVDKLYVDFTGDYSRAVSKLLTTFLGRGDIESISPALIDKWTRRFEKRPFHEFEEFVRAEIGRHQETERNHRFLREATEETLTSLLSHDAWSMRGLTQRLALVAHVYGCVSECGTCSGKIVDLERLVKVLKEHHQLLLSEAQIAMQLARFIGDFEMRGGYQCRVCFSYRNQGAD